MKKIIITIILAFIAVITFNANAQLKITNTTEDRPVIVKSLSMADGNILMRSGEEYMFVISKTTNQFDNPMIFHLGTDKEEILNSLNVLYATIDEIGNEEIITINNGSGKEFNLKKWVVSEKDMKRLEKLAKLTKTELDPCLIVTGKGYAGSGTIFKSALKSAIDYFTEQ